MNLPTYPDKKFDAFIVHLLACNKSSHNIGNML